MVNRSEIDRAASFVCIVNAVSGTSAARARRESIEAAMNADGHTGEPVFAVGTEPAALARAHAAKASAARSAMVAVGG